MIKLEKPNLKVTNLDKDSAHINIKVLPSAAVEKSNEPN